MTATSKGRLAHGIANGYRSGLEDKVAEQLSAAGLSVQYEAVTFRYTKPVRPSRYTPDFVLPNGIIVETKGRFITDDRQKHKLIKEQHPDLDVRFVFSNSKTTIASQKSTAFREWLLKEKGIKAKVVSAKLRAAFQDEFFTTLKTKPSTTTYAQWCEKYGFKWADKLVPVEWLVEPVCPSRIKAIEEATK